MARENKIDKTDLEIISLLEKDAKTKLHVIANKLKLPISTVHFRIQKLEKEKIINYKITKDYKALGQNIKAEIIIYANPKELRLLKKTQSDLAKELIKINNVDIVDIITGDGDLLVVVRAKDVEELNNIILNRIQSLEGINNTKTLIVLQEIKK